MKKASIFVFLFLIFFAHTDNVSAQNDTASSGSSSAPARSASDKIIVVFKEKPSAVTLLNVAKADNTLSPSYALYGENSMVYAVSGGDVKGAVAKISQNTGVAKAFPNYYLHTLAVPNDTYLIATPMPGKPKLQWNMYNLKLADTGKSAWDVTTGSSSVVVAVIDSGVDSTHPDLSGKLSSTVDCVSSCQEISNMSDDPTAPHGTHVSGLVGAATNNGIGIAGAGYNTKIMVLKVMDQNGYIEISALINAIKWAADHGAKVINMSIGQIEEMLDSSAISTLNDAVKYAWDKGVLLVSAAGNCGGNSSGNTKCAILDANGNITGYANNSKSYPAASPNVLSVAALTVDNSLASYSEHNDSANAKIGNWVSVAAPGGNCTVDSDADKYNCILSTLPSSKYGYIMGTSQASPEVAGIAALVFAANPSLSNSQVKSIIENTANKSIAGVATNFGMVDALAAVTSASSNTTPSPSSNPTTTPTSGVTPSVEPSGSLTPTSVVTPSITLTPMPTNTPSPSPYPTVPPKLPKTFPVNMWSAPFCPSLAGCPKKQAGDVNCDGTVDYTDYLLWKEAFDTMMPSAPNNQNADFACVEGNRETYFVDMVNFEIWRRNTVSGLIQPAPVASTGGPVNPSATNAPNITGAQPTSAAAPTSAANNSSNNNPAPTSAINNSTSSKDQNLSNDPSAVWYVRGDPNAIDPGLRDVNKVYEIKPDQPPKDVTSTVDKTKEIGLPPRINN